MKEKHGKTCKIDRNSDFGKLWQSNLTNKLFFVLPFQRSGILSEQRNALSQHTII